MASVDLNGHRRDETVSDGEGTETQPYLERIATDTEELEEEQKTNLDQVYNLRLFESRVGGLSSVEGFLI
jgi:hypothetical protein